MLEYKVAEALGLPVAVMRQVISQSEFTGWIRYFSHRQPDPHEIQLAVLSHIAASGLGSKDSKVDDYIISKPKKSTPKNDDTDEPLPNGLLSTNDVMSVFAGIAVPMGE